ncbi:alpha/beta fold hydrolase [Acinetobacter sp.]|uniref:alpha/beta fold hydrolase n=1 Tax=Acinetobacter sp. TaxID=472 RepID=UPI002FD98B53
MQIGSHFFKNRSGLKLHYLSWGQPEQPVIIMLHGLRSYAATWYLLAPLLAERFYVVALDQRGRGQSDWAEYSTYQTEYYVHDLEDLMAELNIDQVILLGHSLGGTNALEFTRLHPEQVPALIVEDIGPGSSIQGDGAERIRREMQTTPLSFNSWDEAAAFWKKLRPLIDEQGIQSRLQNTLVEKQGRIHWRHDQEGIAKARLTFPSIDLWPAVESLNCPTLFIKGGLSDFLSAETLKQIREKKKHVQAVEIAGASHYVHDDQTEQFNQTVQDFLNQLA